jgi:hypothetical protein
MTFWSGQWGVPYSTYAIADCVSQDDIAMMSDKLDILSNKLEHQDDYLQAIEDYLQAILDSMTRIFSVIKKSKV